METNLSEYDANKSYEIAVKKSEPIIKELDKMTSPVALYVLLGLIVILVLLLFVQFLNNRKKNKSEIGVSIVVGDNNNNINLLKSDKYYVMRKLFLFREKLNHNLYNPACQNIEFIKSVEKNIKHLKKYIIDNKQEEKLKRINRIESIKCVPKIPMALGRQLNYHLEHQQDDDIQDNHPSTQQSTEQSIQHSTQQSTEQSIQQSTTQQYGARIDGTYLDGQNSTQSKLQLETLIELLNITLEILYKSDGSHGIIDYRSLELLCDIKENTIENIPDIDPKYNFNELKIRELASIEEMTNYRKLHSLVDMDKMPDSRDTIVKKRINLENKIRLDD